MSLILWFLTFHLRTTPQLSATCPTEMTDTSCIQRGAELSWLSSPLPPTPQAQKELLSCGLPASPEPNGETCPHLSRAQERNRVLHTNPLSPRHQSTGPLPSRLSSALRWSMF